LLINYKDRIAMKKKKKKKKKKNKKNKRKKKKVKDFSTSRN
jgi:hypothetical protein